MRTHKRLEVKANLHLDARGETAGKFSAVFDGYHNKYPVNDPAFKSSRPESGKLITGDECLRTYRSSRATVFMDGHDRKLTGFSEFACI